ncbi:MAG: hypothetical protein R2827_08445 [Bdellovibrionales bacterium]
MYAAIDIGSNGVRLAILQKHSVETTVIRVPIRLGGDTFKCGKITDKNKKKLTKAMQHFRRILDDNGVYSCRAVATSALREAKNNKQVISDVKKKSGIEIELIDGSTEAWLIQKAVENELHLNGAPHLIMDIGGGSVEFIAAQANKIHHVCSLRIGTVRLLNLVKESNPVSSFEKYLELCEEKIETLDKLKEFALNNRNELRFIGTGGNFRRLQKLKNTLKLGLPSTPLQVEDLGVVIDTLLSMSFKNRIDKLQLRKDRADVILPASALVVAATQFFEIDEIIIPKSGLKDGVIFNQMEDRL